MGFKWWKINENKGPSGWFSVYTMAFWSSCVSSSLSSFLHPSPLAPFFEYQTRNRIRDREMSKIWTAVFWLEKTGNVSASLPEWSSCFVNELTSDSWPRAATLLVFFQEVAVFRPRGSNWFLFYMDSCIASRGMPCLWSQLTASRWSKGLHKSFAQGLCLYLLTSPSSLCRAGQLTACVSKNEKAYRRKTGGSISQEWAEE